MTKKKAEEDLAPKACQQHACAIQTCIVRFDNKPDPVAHCRPYFDAYEACIERLEEAKANQIQIRQS